ncbi:Gfo/Idh/MocA family oxidoreductase [Candidatus Bathyarchaeota archaeon]|nr:Gfo/Idh/MocA family oxidoreductase [Candidatus Bathyarchaeota archaeon]
MADKLQLGIVGCGGIGVTHLKGLVKNPFVELTAFCDANINQARNVAQQFRPEARVFDNAETMINEIKLDVLYLCIPPFAHGVEHTAIDRGIPFFVEKPIHLDLNQAKQIASEIESKKVLTSVGYMNRYRKGVQRVREVLKEDPPILLLGGWVGGTPRFDASAPSFSWWVDKAKSGGQFHEQVTHTVDLARYLCGEVAEVHAYSARGLNKGTAPNYNIEDASVVGLKFRSGAVGALWASCSSNAGEGGVSLTIYGLRTTALFTKWEHNLRLLQVDKWHEEILGEPNIFEIEDYAFIEAVRSCDESKILCPYSDAVKTLEITLAANTSMETGKPVKISG